MKWPLLADLGFQLRQIAAGWGYGVRLLWRLLALSGRCLKRFNLVREQVHFLGNYSLAIITVSGLFVGFVLGLQGYYTLQRYGSAEALGLLVALSLVRELGPVVAALLFAGVGYALLSTQGGDDAPGAALSQPQPPSPPLSAPAAAVPETEPLNAGWSDDEDDDLCPPVVGAPISRSPPPRELSQQ